MGFTTDEKEYLKCVLNGHGIAVEVGSIEFTSAALHDIEDIIRNGVSSKNQNLKTNTIRLSKDAYDILRLHQHSYELYAEGIRDCGDEQKGVRLSLEKVVFELPLVPQSNIKINSDNVEINGLNILVYKGKNSYVYMPEDEE